MKKKKKKDYYLNSYITTGKYNGETYKHIIEKDLKYIMWMFTNYQESIVGCALEEYGFNRLFFPFGKHRGKNIIDILSEDEDYNKWLQETSSYSDFFVLINIEINRKSEYTD